jgi:hypothetical protein
MRADLFSGCFDPGPVPDGCELGCCCQHRRPPVDPMETLQVLAKARADNRAELEASVGALRAAGGTWADVGRALGVTRQSARQRFGTGAAGARLGTWGDSAAERGIDRPPRPT